MVPERYWRYPTPAARMRVAAVAAIANEDWMQDWPLEVSDADRLGEFIELLQRASDDDDRFTLMSLVLCSLELADTERQVALWPTIGAILEASPSLFAHEIIYWSCGEEVAGGAWKLDDAEEYFSTTHLMRTVLLRVASGIGLALVP